MRTAFSFGVTLIIGLGIGFVIGREVAEVPLMHNTLLSMTHALEGKTGDELEKAFLDEMIVHHEGAVEMAELLLAGANRPELIQLGTDIISAQTKEITMMREWREKWFTY